MLKDLILHLSCVVHICTARHRFLFQHTHLVTGLQLVVLGLKLLANLLKQLPSDHSWQEDQLGTADDEGTAVVQHSRSNHNIFASTNNAFGAMLGQVCQKCTNSVLHSSNIYVWHNVLHDAQTGEA